MNIKALITTFVLGSSSIAMARPVSMPGGVIGPSAPATYGNAVIVRDHRTHVPAPAPVPAPSSVDTSGHPPFVPTPAPAPMGGSYHPPFVPPWVTIGTANQIVDGAMAFRVNARQNNGFANGFTTLRLQSTAGKSLINRVEIQFANGGTQVVQIGQYLNAASPMITIDLDGERRTIRNVTVVGRNARQSAFNVQAM